MTKEQKAGLPTPEMFELNFLASGPDSGRRGLGTPCAGPALPQPYPAGRQGPPETSESAADAGETQTQA